MNESDTNRAKAISIILGSFIIYGLFTLPSVAPITDFPTSIWTSVLRTYFYPFSVWSWQLLFGSSLPKDVGTRIYWLVIAYQTATASVIFLIVARGLRYWRSSRLLSFALSAVIVLAVFPLLASRALMVVYRKPIAVVQANEDRISQGIEKAEKREPYVNFPFSITSEKLVLNGDSSLKALEVKMALTVPRPGAADVFCSLFEPSGPAYRRVLVNFNLSGGNRVEAKVQSGENLLTGRFEFEAPPSDVPAVGPADPQWGYFGGVTGDGPYLISCEAAGYDPGQGPDGETSDEWGALYVSSPQPTVAVETLLRHNGTGGDTQLPGYGRLVDEEKAADDFHPDRKFFKNSAVLRTRPYHRTDFLK